MREQLISFGNFLFERYKVGDGRGNTRQVGDWDLANFDYSQQLPSRFQVGDPIRCVLGFTGVVTKVHFSEGKVMYDIEVSGTTQHANGTIDGWHTRVHNVDSTFVEEPDTAGSAAV